MKHVRMVEIGGTLFGIGLMAGFMLACWIGEDNTCLQQQAVYQATVELYEQDQAVKRDTLEIMQARLDLKDETNQKLRLKLASAQAATVKLSRLDQEVQEIKAHAARMAPVEAAAKQQATDNHEFIPAAFRSYWGQVLASGLLRGK